MGDLLELLVEGSVESGMSMAMEVDPNRGSAVEVLSSVSIEKVGAYSPLDNERLLLFPFLHLSEGMPEVLPVPIAKRRRLFSAAHRSQYRVETVKKAVSDDPQPVRARRGLYEGLFTLTTWGAVTIMNRFY